ncbi:hypothetical protein [Microbulbifer halophilus]|uniref:hypothetical protein n=1 Tax=Microbulbifer halophilus TaxID=453963 RepID=UPI00361EF7A4
MKRLTRDIHVPHPSGACGVQIGWSGRSMYSRRLRPYRFVPMRLLSKQLPAAGPPRYLLTRSMVRTAHPT